MTKTIIIIVIIIPTDSDSKTAMHVGRDVESLLVRMHLYEKQFKKLNRETTAATPHLLIPRKNNSNSHNKAHLPANACSSVSRATPHEKNLDSQRLILGEIK